MATEPEGLLGDAAPPEAETGIFPEWSNDDALDVAFSDWQPNDTTGDGGPAAAEVLLAPEALGKPEPQPKRRRSFSFGGKRRGKKAPTQHVPAEEVTDGPLDIADPNELPSLETDSDLALEAILGQETEGEAPEATTRRRGGLRKSKDKQKDKKERGAAARKAAPAPEAAAHDVAAAPSSSAVALLDDDLLPNRKR